MTAFWLGSAGLLGACVGSFLNVCIHRLPREGLTVSRPRGSFCPACGKSILWHDNIPVLSWLLLGGRCRTCSARIPLRYPLVELLTAGLFIAVMLRSLVLADPSVESIATAAFWACVLAALVVVSFVDLDHRIIPDEVSITGAALAPLGAVWLPAVPVYGTQPQWLAEWCARLDLALWPGAGGGVALAGAGLGAVAAAWGFHRWSPRWDGGQRTWWETRLAASVGAGVGWLLAGFLLVGGFWDELRTQRVLAAFLGMGLGAGSLYAIGWLGKLAFRKDAMGLGDVKLLALLGAVLGWQGALLAVFMASLLGSVGGILVKLITRSSYIPFGPFLAAGAAVLILWPEGVSGALDAYLALFR